MVDYTWSRECARKTPIVELKYKGEKMTGPITKYNLQDNDKIDYMVDESFLDLWIDPATQI